MPKLPFEYVQEWMDRHSRGGRYDHGLQKQMASAIGQSQATVSRIISGTHRLQQIQSSALIRFFKLSYDTPEVKAFLTAVDDELARKKKRGPKGDPHQLRQRTRPIAFRVEPELVESNVELFNLTIFTPPQDGDGAEEYPLPVSIDVGLPDGIESGYKWEMGIARFKLLAWFDRCQITRENSAQIAGVRREAGAWIFSAENGLLRHELLPGDSFLAHFTPVGKRHTVKIKLEAQALDTDFRLRLIRIGPPAEGTKAHTIKEKVLQRMFQKARRDDDSGRVLLARSTLIGDRGDEGDA